MFFIAIEMHYRYSQPFSISLVRPFPSTQNVDTKDNTYHANLGLTAELNDQWSLDIAATRGRRKADISTDVGAGFRDPDVEKSKIGQYTAYLSGEAFNIKTVPVNVALGGELRTEKYVDIGRDGIVDADLSRDVVSVFGEVQLPIVADGDLPGLHRLEVSGAVRWDDYNDVGDTTNPQFGIIWSPIEDLTFRANYASAFRAPSLFLTDPNAISTQVRLAQLADPQSASGFTPGFITSGVTVGLQPEKADTYSVTVDYAPSFWEGANISVSFFDINYDQRIEQPVNSSEQLFVLQNEGIYTDVVTRMPSAAELDEFLARALSSSLPPTLQVINQSGTPFNPLTDDILTVFPDIVLLDNQRQNIAVEEVQGLDFQFRALCECGIGRLNYGLNGTYYIKYKRYLTPDAPAIDQLNAPGRPVDFRLRGNVGLDTGPIIANIFVNYTDGYEDIFVTPSVGVDSYVTVDLSVQLDVGELVESPIMEGFAATVAVRNLLDEGPPFIQSPIFGLSFDGANADPFGRIVSLRLVKKF